MLSEDLGQADKGGLGKMEPEIMERESYSMSSIVDTLSGRLSGLLFPGLCIAHLKKGVRVVSSSMTTHLLISTWPLP